MRNFVTVEYKVNGQDVLNQNDKTFELAIAKTQHLSAIFVLIQCLDVSLFEDDTQTLQLALRHIGGLGEAIAGGLLFTIEELNGKIESSEVK